MAIIHILSKETIDKIAAGEVAERPESVVKELVDNALDSGADTVSVELKGGGLELIRVTDNGCGIPKEEVPAAFIRHATSKLETAADIEHVRTMGFRGEALASIAAVSHVELITRTAADLTGLWYKISQGREEGSREIGAPEGTTVLVRDFLFNVPVRRQFLKSAAIENSYMVDTVEKAALAHPNVSFSLTSEGRRLLQTTGNGRLKDVIYTVYGPEIAANLLEIRYPEEGENDTGIRITGYAGKPVISRSRRDHEVFFVNGRPIRSDLLQKAVEDAYAPFMMQHRFPMAILHIELPPEAVDVNVHPRKTEVRFADGKTLYDAVCSALTGVLSRKEHIIEAGSGPQGGGTRILAAAPAAAPAALSGAASSDAAPAAETQAYTPPERPAPWSREPLPFEKKRRYEYVSDIVDELYRAAAAGEQHAARDRDAEDAFLSPANAPYFKMIGQIFDTYWIIEYNNEMYLVDQHAAHEKVNYERYRKLISSHAVSSQMLYPPIVLTLTAREAALMEKQAEAFAALGYEIEAAGDRDYIVRAVPSNLPQMGEETLLKELIQSMSEESGRLSSEMMQDKIASMSCKAAVKGNRRLSEPEMKALIGELLTLDNPYACPHGRPTIARWSKADLDRIFKRIV